MGDQQDVRALLDSASHKFREIFNCAPEVAASAPGRVNIIGEYTDFNGGFVFPMALPLVTVVVGRKCPGSTIRVVTMADGVRESGQVEFAVPSADSPLEPGAPAWANYVKGVVAGYPGSLDGFQAVITTSVPIGGGLSSSASLEVATFTFLEQLFPVSVSPVEKALACQKAEHVFAGMPCGIMDQFTSTMGQSDCLLLIDCENMTTKSVPFTNPAVVVLIVNSNVKHELTGSEYPTIRQQCHSAAEASGKASLRHVTPDDLEKCQLEGILFDRPSFVVEEISRTQTACKVLENGDYAAFGKLMYESHVGLRDKLRVSCPEVDQLVEIAMSVPGVYGSRMTGGGFGGCTVSLVKKDSVDTVMDAIKFPIAWSLSQKEIAPKECKKLAATIGQIVGTDYSFKQ